MKESLPKWNDESLEVAAEAFKALGHPARIKIIAVLVDGGSSVNEIVSMLDIPQAVVSQHLRRLWTQGFLKRERAGNRIIYRLARPEISTILYCVHNCLCLKA